MIGYRLLLRVGVFIFLIFSGFQQSVGQNRLILHPELAKDTISKEIYGHFAEHLGRCIYGGIYVGEDSPIENIRGFRMDVIQALKAIDIGNETWGCGGNMTPEYYADLYRQFATYCFGAEFLIASGANAGDYHWTEVMMEKTQYHQ